MAGVKGLEPSTYRVTGDRSNQLSYTPPKWWAVKDSNLWPSRCKRDALPTELTALFLLHTKRTSYIHSKLTFSSIYYANKIRTNQDSWCASVLRLSLINWVKLTHNICSLPPVSHFDRGTTMNLNLLFNLTYRVP